MRYEIHSFVAWRSLRLLVAQAFGRLLPHNCRLQADHEFHSQAITVGHELKLAATALCDRLDNREPKTTAFALAVSPETFGEALNQFGRNAWPPILHDKADLAL